MRRYFALFTLLSFAIYIASCGGDNSQDDGPSDKGSINLTKDYAYQGEVFSFSIAETLNGTKYSASIGTESVNVSNQQDRLLFIVPTTLSGKQAVKMDLDGHNIEFELTINELPEITDPEGFIDSYVEDFNSDLTNFKLYKDSFISDSVFGFEDLQKDISIWTEIEQKANDELQAMSRDQKLQLAKVLSANEEWISGLDDIVLGERLAFKKSSKTECKKIIKEGRAEQKKGNRFTALGKSIEAYWCAVNIQKLEDADTEIEKGITLIEETEDIWMLNTLTNFIGRKIEEITNEVNSLGSMPGVAEELEEADSEKRASVLSFVSGEALNVKATIRFRTINESDANAEGGLGTFASFFSDLVNSYDRLISVIDRPLIWRPGFSDKTKTVEFNRYLTVDKNSISNPVIALVNTQYNGDLWEVIFGNDGFEAEPEFKFDLIYDDGHVTLSKTLNAKIANCRLGSVKDSRDGKTYQTVTIGDQVWFAENLNYITSGSYEYSEASRPNFDGFGRYYTWYDARQACPSGWHIPSVEEWEDLFDNLGGRGASGSKLKSTTDWEDDGGNNQSCFNARPGGAGWMDLSGKIRTTHFQGAYAGTQWWTSTEGTNDSTHTAIALRSYSNYVGNENIFDLVPLTCRCLKD